MAGLSVLQVVAVLWGVVSGIYLLLFLVGSIVGLREEDTLYLSAGESKMAAEQRDIQKRVNKVAAYTHIFGWAALGLTVVLAGIWLFGVARELL